MRFINTGFLLASLVLASAAASAQTVDEIIEKSVTAQGGRAALGKLTSRSIAGTMTVSTPGGDISGTIEAVNQAPNKLRRVINLDLTALGAGSAVIELRFDGTSAYQMDSMRGDSAVTGSQLELLRNSVFPSPFLDYKDHGTKITLSGKEKAGDKDAYALLVTPATGPVTRVLLDAETYLPVRTVVTVDVPDVGGSVEQTTAFSDYRDVDGVKVPYTIKGTSDVQTFLISITKVEHNVKVDPALFSKPVAK
jgi:zinc protease